MSSIILYCENPYFVLTVIVVNHLVGMLRPANTLMYIMS